MERETDDEARVDAMIRAAGHRSPIPAPDLAALRETASLHWQRMVETERRRKRRMRATYAIAASMVIALLGGWWWLDRATPGRSAPMAIAVAGTGESLFPGGRIEVAEPIALRMIGGSSVRLDAGTSVRLVSGSQVELARGAVYVDSGREGSAGDSLEIVTAAGIVREVGTQYEVRLQLDEVSVRVREGRVALDREGVIEYAQRGESLRVRPDGTIERGTVALHGPEWSWVLNIAPALEIEGCTLAAYLDWIARETGWRVHYADEALTRSAQTIRLHGTIQGLRPDESLDVVLPGARLGHQIDGDMLRVFRNEG